jgi:hypothetical protein
LQWFSSVFSGVFASVSEACFKCSFVFFCMLQVLHLNVLKVDCGVAYRMRVESRRGCERFAARRLAGWATSGALARSLTLLEALACLPRGHRPMLAPRIGRTGASKSAMTCSLMTSFLLHLAHTNTWAARLTPWIGDR